TLLRERVARQPGAFWAQWALTRLGYDTGGVDGYFWGKTAAAVKAFQRARGLEADGIVGPLTAAALTQ
ncbi:MAG: peptidoglycan-binding domain-containing protein, partial [bacterium]